MYLSGRPLHAVTVNLAASACGDLGGDLPLSFAGGADCFNVADLLRRASRPSPSARTSCKSGGYLRMLQYPEHVEAAFDAAGATDTGDFVLRTAHAAGYAGDAGSTPVPSPPARSSTCAATPTPSGVTGATGRTRSGRIAPRRRAGSGPSTASPRPAWTSARWTSRCPATWPPSARGSSPRRSASPAWTTRCPTVLGRVCDHLCENTCIRTHLDQPLAIRQIKRFIMEQEREASPRPAPPATAARVAIVGCRAGRPRGRRVAGVRRRRRHHLRGASVCRRHGRWGDPHLPAAAGADRPGPRRPRAPWRRDPVRPACRRRRHARRAAGGRVRGHLRGRGRPAGEAARPAGRGLPAA